MILRGIGVSNFALATAARMGSDKFHEIWLNGRRMGGTFLLFPADNARERHAAGGQRPKKWQRGAAFLQSGRFCNYLQSA